MVGCGGLVAVRGAKVVSTTWSTARLTSSARRYVPSSHSISIQSTPYSIPAHFPASNRCALNDVRSSQLPVWLHIRLSHHITDDPVML